jgi:Ser/Thr protein kinase RdoA (MazF antagonist)
MIQPMSLLEMGPTADTYLLLDGGILKLFRQGVEEEVATQEVTGIQAAQAVGVRAPVVREVVEYQGRWGIVFEQLQGPTMLQVLLSNPEQAEELGRQLATLHADLHGREAKVPLPSELPPFHAALRYVIPNTDLPERIQTAVLTALESLPSGTTLCHGDFHPHNVMLTPTGPVILDWADSFISCPAADVANTRMLLRYMEPGSHANPSLLGAINTVRSRFHDAYWQRYSELRPADAAQVAGWTLPIAAVHLSSPGSDPKRQALLNLIESLLKTS